MLTTSVLPRLVAVVGWIVVAAGVAFSRIELGMHWTTDVLASLVFVPAWLVVLGMMFGGLVAGAASQSGEDSDT